MTVQDTVIGSSNHQEIEMKAAPDSNRGWADQCPIEILEQVFFHLKPQDLCACAQVCWNWNHVSSQNTIWKPRLDRESPKWKFITNDKFRECSMKYGTDEEYYCKQTYLLTKPSASHRSKGSVIYKTLSRWTNKRFKVAFFGSGLELTGPKRIADGILRPNNASPFIAENLAPGNAGSGSGVNVKLFNNSYTICILYSNRKDVREQRLDMHPYSSLLFEDKVNPEDDNEELVVKKDIAKTLQEMDGLVYIVNCETKRKAHLVDKKDFHALQAVCKAKVPLAVMANIFSNDRDRYSVIDMCQFLELQTLERPWICQSTIESSFSGIPEALEWLSKKI